MQTADSDVVPVTSLRPDHCMPLFRVFVILACTVIAEAAEAQSAGPRPLRAGDIYRLRSLGDPQISTDGQRIAYSVSSAASSRDDTVTYVRVTSGARVTPLPTPLCLYAAR